EDVVPDGGRDHFAAGVAEHHVELVVGPSVSGEFGGDVGRHGGVEHRLGPQRRPGHALEGDADVAYRDPALAPLGMGEVGDPTEGLGRRELHGGVDGAQVVGVRLGQRNGAGEDLTEALDAQADVLVDGQELVEAGLEFGDVDGTGSVDRGDGLAVT